MEYYVITGASRGLGRALCREFARADVAIICLSWHVDRETFDILKSSCALAEWVEVDFTDYRAVEPAISGAVSSLRLKKGDRLTLINNAGRLAPIGPFVETSADDIASNVAVNILASAILSRFVVKTALARRVDARVVNISSPSAESPRANWAIYGMSKGALNYLSKAIALESGDKSGVVAISVYPGVMDTDMRKENLAARPLLVRALDWVKRVVLRRKPIGVSSPEETARKIAWALATGNYRNGGIVDCQRIRPVSHNN